jgi:acyl-CoA synthetase (AMP-forming)/AMP-acid ligase II
MSWTTAGPAATEIDQDRTTGLPKGVELTHYNIISNAEQIIAKRLLVADSPAGRARRERLDTSSERWLAAVPMYHAFVSITPRYVSV